MALTGRDGAFNLRGAWSFTLGEVPGASWPEFDDSGWERVDVPHTYNDVDTFCPPRGYYRGPAWYRKTFKVPKKGRRSFLRFDGAWGRAHVWLNGRDYGEHLGGLAGFEIEVTGSLQEENTLAVMVDNSPDPEVLPGKPVPDYNVYGGLCGQVSFVPKPKTCFPWRSLFITTPAVDRTRAEIDIDVGILRSGSDNEARGRAQIFDVYDNAIASTGEITAGLNEKLSFHFELQEPRLWKPNDPRLYVAQVELLSDGRVLDTQRQSFGIRSFVFRPDKGFILDGERVQLRGLNRHQDFPGLGNVLPDRMHRRDAEIIKECGGNFVRTSHYPQHPSFLKACDDLGIMVYEEITSWQFVGGDDFIASANGMMASMIARDRNHPSIILWGMMNEGRSKKMFDKLKQTAILQDPTRPTIYADNRLGDGVFQGTVFVPDVLGINYKLESIDAFHSAYPHLKLLVAEHTNADMTERGCSDLEKAQSQRVGTDLDLIEAREFLAGSALWSMHDYGTDYEPVWPVQKSGVLDAYRNPKEAYHMLSARWGTQPVIHIASDWDRPHVAGDPIEVRVYTNCEEVELALDGRSLGKKEGANPVVWVVPYEEGTITAIGGRRRMSTVSDSVVAPGAVFKLHLECPDQVRAHEDAVLVAARILDSEGNPVPVCEGEVRFTARGPGKLAGLLGGSSAPVRLGTANIVLRSIGKKGTIELIAERDGLVGDAVRVRSV